MYRSCRKKLLSKRNRGETGFSPTSPADLFLRNKKRSCPQKRTAYKHKSFASGERRLKSKKKSRLAGKLNPERFAARAPRITTTEKQRAAERTVLPKRGECSAAAEKNCFLAEQRGNRIFPYKSGRFIFAEQKKKLSAKADSLQTQVFRQRRKTLTEQKEIASGRNSLAGMHLYLYRKNADGGSFLLKRRLRSV